MFVNAVPFVSLSTFSSSSDQLGKFLISVWQFCLEDSYYQFSRVWILQGAYRMLDLQPNTNNYSCPGSGSEPDFDPLHSPRLRYGMNTLATRYESIDQPTLLPSLVSFQRYRHQILT